MIDEQAKQITKSITPKYPLGYSAVYPIIFEYLQECYMKNVRYNYEEIEKRLSMYVIKGSR